MTPNILCRPQAISSPLCIRAFPRSVSIASMGIPIYPISISLDSTQRLDSNDIPLNGRQWQTSSSVSFGHICIYFKRFSFRQDQLAQNRRISCININSCRHVIYIIRWPGITKLSVFQWMPPSYSHFHALQILQVGKLLDLPLYLKCVF